MTPQEIIAIKLGTYELASRNTASTDLLGDAKKLFSWVTKEADDAETERVKERDAQNAKQKIVASGTISPFVKPTQDAPF